MTDSPRPSSQPAAIPADDPKRNLVLVRPDDPNLPHTGLVGDTYTVLLTGKDTAGRYCLIDMHIPPCGGPSAHRHDFEEMFTLLEGRSSSPSVAQKRSCELARLSTFRPMHRTSSGTPLGAPCDCYACARRPARKSFSWLSVSPSLAAPHPRQSSTRPRKRRSKRKHKHLPRNTGRSS